MYKVTFDTTDTIAEAKRRAKTGKFANMTIIVPDENAHTSVTAKSPSKDLLFDLVSYMWSMPVDEVKKDWGFILEEVFAGDRVFGKSLIKAS
jgi:hypothetical protein